MQTRLKREDQERLLARYQAIRRNLENGTCTGNHGNCKMCLRSKAVIGAWKAFMRLKPIEQEHIRNEWEAYYEKVKETNQFKIVEEQKKAFAAQDMQRVKELAVESKLMTKEGLIPELKEPDSVDPNEFVHGMWVRAWIDVDNAIKALTAYPIDEERKDVWS